MLEPLGPRRDAAFDEDAGPELPPGATPCKTAAECDDGIDCTVDACVSNLYCRNTVDNNRCSDNIVCNGAETCIPEQGGCVSAPPPGCDDRDPCTIDRCDEAAKDCVHLPRDFDHDGEADYHCPGGTDCDDFDASRRMNTPEVCRDGIDNDCDDVVDESMCGVLPHDKCDDALELGAGGSFEVPVVGAVGDYITGCSQMESGHDLVFTFKLDEPHDVKLTARGYLADGGDETASVAIQRSCGDIASEVQCGRSLPGDVRVRALPAGRYYVIASTSNACRSLVLTADFGPVTPAPTNSTCDKALDIGQGGHFESDFVDVGDDILSPCTIAGQPDVFYAFHLDEERDVEIAAVGSEKSAVAVSVRPSCDPMAEAVRCDSGMRVLSRLHRLAKGDYILVVEGPTTREIAYTLDVAIREPTAAPVGDSCDAPLPVTLGMPQRITLAGLLDDTSSSCETPRSPDAVLKLTVPERQDLHIKLDGGTERCAVALQGTCGDMASEHICRAGMPLDARLHDVRPGEYYVIVESVTAQGVTLQIDAQPLTPTTLVMGNDTCYMAAEIPSSGGLFVGNTAEMIDDYNSARCGGGAMSKDAVFKLVVESRKRVSAMLDASFDCVLLRYKAPGDGSPLCSGEPEKCVDNTANNNNEVLDELLDAGTYYFVVDGFKGINAGAYQFDVNVSEP